MKQKWISTPYIIWMILFIVIPLVLVVYYGFTTTNMESEYHFTLEYFQRFFEPVYIKVLWRSIYLALISTIICLILGYPMAMILASRDLSKKNTLVMLFVIPMWMNFLLRTYAWLTLLERNGVINGFIQKLGLSPIQLLYTNEAVILGMVYNFLPFMVLPIYSVLKKMDYRLLEAAQDLGANVFQTFIRVIFPLSFPGVISGITMVFMPAVTTFVISRLLGGGHFMLIGNLIEEQFLTVGNWHFGASLSIVLMLIILFSISIMSKYEGEKTGGMGLW